MVVSDRHRAARSDVQFGRTSSPVEAAAIWAAAEQAPERYGRFTTRGRRPDVFLVSWIDGEMALLAQIVDLENGTVLATIPSEDEPDTTEIITATISSFDD